MGKLTYIIFYFIFLLASTGCKPGISCETEPELFCQAFREIEVWVGPNNLAALESRHERNPASIHDAIGQDVRNRLELWSENDLTRFFRKNGVNEPEQMSYGVTIGLEKYRAGVSVDMVAICRQLAVPLAPPPPQPLGQSPSTEPSTRQAAR